jgi:ParB/RepB/Spo0J family partition protein
VSENRILKKPTLHLVAALAGKEEESCARQTDVHELTLDEIDLANTQFEYRLDPDIEVLMESIRRDGQQLPVILRGKRPPYQLVCGFRRVRSIKALGEAKVKAIIIEELDDVKAHRLSVLENEERKSLTDLDRANACKRFYDEGRTQEEVAELMGCSRIKVNRYLSLLKMEAPVFEALRKGRIPTMHALLLHQAYEKFSSEQIALFIEQIAKKELSTRELEKLIRRVDKRGKPVKKPELFKETAKGFRLAGISYSKDMPKEEKKQVVAVLKKALQLLTGKEGTNG